MQFTNIWSCISRRTGVGIFSRCCILPPPRRCSSVPRAWIHIKIKNDSSPTFLHFHGGSGGLDIGISLLVCGVWSGSALMLFRSGIQGAAFGVVLLGFTDQGSAQGRRRR